ncbi:AP endonuclease [Pseudomonas sp. S75]|uniref:sugar phosphate isomerase/epimerase family protein n=1 Tax=unclassified Pseudomonas TaxID=196821 RepID=UPI001905056C|nr:MULTISPECIES: AP endonuclease [unclassified Pseudomonas]MBJ9975698.1 AP endonuclease [Pseudomonas sp. S30]MBK0153249.1 AP endonuclease [Pseudomonas sp. S75]
MQPYPVSISLSSYGADLVRQYGQLHFIELLADAGVDCIELREELFDTPPDVPVFKQALAQSGLECVYSSPLELWTRQGGPDPRLPHTLASARALGAVALKVSLGHLRPDCDLAALQPWLKAGDPLLLIENDQTAQGGRLDALLSFFQRAQQAELPVGMTFDIGNWQWQGESATQAAHQLGQWVRYVHCKGVERNRDGRLVAVPPQPDELAAWERLFRHFPPGVPRAAEYPLVGADLKAVTHLHACALARLGGHPEVSHA